MTCILYCCAVSPVFATCIAEVDIILTLYDLNHNEQNLCQQKIKWVD
jgi:hypothetical protein